MKIYKLSPETKYTDLALNRDFEVGEKFPKGIYVTTVSLKNAVRLIRGRIARHERLPLRYIDVDPSCVEEVADNG